MGHIIIISILFVNSLLIKNLFTCQLVKLVYLSTCSLVNSFNLFTRKLVHSSTRSTKQLLKVLKDRTLGRVVTTEVLAIT